MSPVSPVLHTMETVILSLYLTGTNTPCPDIKMSMLECIALKFFSPTQAKQNLVLLLYLPSTQVRNQSWTGTN